MHTLLSFFLRLILVAAGLMAAASVALVATGLAGLWLARRGLARITGKPAQAPLTPFRVRPQESRTPRADAARPMRPLRGLQSVVDVEPK